MSEKSSYRQILRSSSIIGGASVINIAIGLIRTKVVAVLLGPAGVGLIGLFQSLMATAGAISALGFGKVGTRQIAEAQGDNDPAAAASARRALFWGSIGLAAIGAIIFWSLRHILAARILGDPGKDWLVGWLAVGVSLTVISEAQVALLNGLRRVGDLARVSILAAVLSTVLGVGAVRLWGEQGMLAFVLAVPLSSALMGRLFVSRLPKLTEPRTRFARLFEQWKVMFQLGAAFMLAGLAATVGHLAVRTLVQRELGPDSLGHFEAAWLISMTYIGFVLRAMGTDFYPRLTAVIRDRNAVNRLVNEQSEVALLMAGPILVAMLGLAPWIVELLYTDQFGAAVSVLRWQVLGDVLKVASWPIGFIILAAGDGRTFMFSESLVTAVFVGLTWFGLPIVGISATGMAFLGMYVVCLPTVFIIARFKTGFAWSPRVYLQFVILLLVAALVFIAGEWSYALSAGLGLLGSAALGIQAIARLGHMADLDGPLGAISDRSQQLMKKMGVWHE